MAITAQDIRNMPLRWKIIIGILGIILLLYFYYFYFMHPLLTRHEILEANLATLEAKIIEKEKLVSEIDRYKKGIEELRQKFAVVVQKLPEQKEIPGLMTAISTEGRSEGLEILLFEPAPPIPKDFYDEIPIRVNVKGKYAEIWGFFEKVAALPRVVNVTDASISRNREISRGRENSRVRENTDDLLTANCLMKTYMYVERPNVEEGEGKGKK